MNKLKGFTLAELIVVIAIIGILAAILVPNMIGYVNRAKFSSANSVAKTLYNAGMAACLEYASSDPVKNGTYTNDSSGGTADGDENKLVYNTEINKYIYQYARDLENGKWAVKIKDGSPVAACYRNSSADFYLGTYPNANNTKYDPSGLLPGIKFAEKGEEWA